MKPTLIGVMGAFSSLASRRNWRDLEDFMNPLGAFEEVHVVSVGDSHEYERTRFGSVIVHPLRPLRVPASATAIAKTLNGLHGIVVAHRYLKRLVRDVQPDLVAQIYGGPLNYGLPVVATGRRERVPAVLTLHNDYRSLIERTYPAPIRWVSRYAWRYLFRHCTAMRSVSQHIAKFAWESGVPTAKVHVIPNKEDLGKFATPPHPSVVARVARRHGLDDHPSDAVTFLTVARLIPAKNFEGMLRAVAIAVERSPSIRYVIAGDGPLRGRLERLVQELGLGRHVRFLGFVPHDDLRSIYHLSNVFLFATHYEGQPRALVEAVLAGLPVICADYGQVTEIVENEQDGLWVSPSDPCSIAGAIDRLARDSELRRRFREHPDFDPEEYSIPAVSRREADFYLSVIDRFRKPETSPSGPSAEGDSARGAMAS